MTKPPMFPTVGRLVDRDNITRGLRDVGLNAEFADIIMDGIVRAVDAAFEAFGTTIQPLDVLGPVVLLQANLIALATMREMAKLHLDVAISVAEDAGLHIVKR